MKAHEIEKRQLIRLRLLYELYNFSSTQITNLEELALKYEIKNGVFEDAFNYLKGEGLIEKANAKLENMFVRISHDGVKIIEQAMLNPYSSSNNFPAFKDLNINP